MHRLVNHCHLRMETQTMALTLHTALKKRTIRKFTWRETEENRAADDGALDDPPWPQVLCCLLGAAEQGGVAVVNLNRPTFEFTFVELGKAIYLSISSNRDLYRVMQSYAGNANTCALQVLVTVHITEYAQHDDVVFSHTRSRRPNTEIIKRSKDHKLSSDIDKNWIPTRSGMFSLYLHERNQLCTVWLY